MNLQIGDLVIIKGSGKSGMIINILDEEELIYDVACSDDWLFADELIKVPTKFKVGDKVKCVRNLWKGGSDKIGEKFEIREIDLDDEQGIIYSHDDIFFLEDELEKYSVTDVIYNHLNNRENKKQTYLGGDLLKKGSIMLRNAEAEELRNVGVELYSPIEDSEINDKQNQSKEDNDKLAEKIVKKDTKAIIESDYIIIEPQNDALGTMVELGQLKGMKDASEMIMDILIRFKDEGRLSYSDLYYEMGKLVKRLNKKVYPHYEDIRRTDILECADRRSWAVNQYVYGVCLDLTNGKGFYEWDDIVKELEKEYKNK